MRRVHLRRNRNVNILGYGEPTINKLKWDLDQTTNNNGASMRLVQDYVYSVWGEDPTGQTNYESQYDYANVVLWVQQDWKWSDVKEQLQLIKTLLSTDPSKNPLTIAAFNGLMDQNAITKSFKVVTSTPNTTPTPGTSGTGNGGGQPQGGGGSGQKPPAAPEPPKMEIPWVPIIGGVTLVGIIGFVLLTRQANEDAEKL